MFGARDAFARPGIVRFTVENSQFVACNMQRIGAFAETSSIATAQTPLRTPIPDDGDFHASPTFSAHAAPTR